MTGNINETSLIPKFKTPTLTINKIRRLPDRIKWSFIAYFIIFFTRKLILSWIVIQDYYGEAFCNKTCIINSLQFLIYQGFLVWIYGIPYASILCYMSILMFRTECELVEISHNYVTIYKCFK